MKSTIEVLDEITKREGFDDFEHYLDYTEGLSINLTSLIQQAMINYARQAIVADRECIVEYYNDEKLTGEQIINALKLELT